MTAVRTCFVEATKVSRSQFDTISNTKLQCPVDLINGDAFFTEQICGLFRILWGHRLQKALSIVSLHTAHNNYLLQTAALNPHVYFSDGKLHNAV